jgi:hypothetical protein
LVDTLKVNVLASREQMGKVLRDLCRHALRAGEYHERLTPGFVVAEPPEKRPLPIASRHGAEVECSSTVLNMSPGDALS